MLGHRSERGSALVISMFMVSLVLVTVTLYVQNDGVVRDIRRKNKMVQARDEAARLLLSNITNEKIVAHAAAEANIRLGDGNAMLNKCLYGDDDSPSDCLRVTGPKTVGADGYYDYPSLVLAPPPDYTFPEEKGGGKNCPSPGHASCYLSSQRKATKKVGYNFSGETGELSACFPLEPVVYVNPNCGTDVSTGKPRTSCQRADSIELAHQLVHRDFGKQCEDKAQQSPGLGSTPKTLNFIDLPRHLFVGYQCNEGAYAKGYTSSGNIECQCRFPYTPTGFRNERGELCNQFEEECPGDTAIVGRKPDGSVICKSTNELSPPFKRGMQVSTSTFAGNLASSSMACDEFGWMQDVDLRCSGTAVPDEEEEKGYSCLFFYGVVKMLDGDKFLDGQVPKVFFPKGERGCYALTESTIMKFPNHWYDAICVAAIAGLLVLNSSSAKKLFVNKKAVGEAASSVVKAATKKAADKMAKATGKVTKPMGSIARKGVDKAVGTKAGAAALKKTMQKVQSVKEIKKAATDAAMDALNNAKQVGSSAKKRVAGAVLDNAVARGVREAADNAQGIAKTVLKEVGTPIVKKGTAAKEALKAQAERVKTMAQRAKSQAAKYHLREVAMAATNAAPFANVVLGDLTPALFAQALALDLAIDIAGFAAKQLLDIPLIGWLIYVAAIAAGSLVLASWQVQVDYNCYPIKQEPSVECRLTATCYDYGREYVK